jgi:hypothetical protein
MRDIFILDEIRDEDTIYILAGTLLFRNMKLDLLYNLKVTEVYANLKTKLFIS